VRKNVIVGLIIAAGVLVISGIAGVAGPAGDAEGSIRHTSRTAECGGC
jgi:hypothetical protein